MKLLHSAVFDNGFVRTQMEWGGSHDIILGQILWLYEIPTASLSYSNVYYGADILKGKLQHTNEISTTKNAIISYSQLKDYIIFHKVSINTVI